MGAEPAARPSLPEASVVTSRQHAPRATSTLELVYRNRIKNAALSVVVDGERVYAGNVTRAPGLFNLTFGKNVWASVDLPPGEHVVDVRVTGEKGKLDLVRQVKTTFEDGRTHRLRISVTRLKNLKLTWKESPNG